MWTKFAQKEYFWTKTEKSEHHHRIQHIWIILYNKFYLKQTTLIFLANICQKRVQKSCLSKKDALQTFPITMEHIYWKNIA